MRNDIAFTMVVRNAAPFMPDVLGTALSLFSEIVVGYDASSTDETLKVMLDILGYDTRANVVAFRNQEFAMEAHNRVQDLVKSPWTFMLDADERISPELYAYLEGIDLPEGNMSTDVFLISRENLVDGEPLAEAPLEPHWRLFRSHLRYVSQKHQFIDVTGDVIIGSIKPPAVIWHHKTSRQARESNARISTYPDKWRGTHAGEPVFLMLGEGENPEGVFIVVSFDPDSKTADLCWDPRLPLPWTEDSIEGIRVGCIIDTITPMQLESSVADWFRVLKPGCSINFGYTPLAYYIRRALDASGCNDVLLTPAMDCFVSITARKAVVEHEAG